MKSLTKSLTLNLVLSLMNTFIVYKIIIFLYYEFIGKILKYNNLMADAPFVYIIIFIYFSLYY